MSDEPKPHADLNGSCFIKPKQAPSPAEVAEEKAAQTDLVFGAWLKAKRKKGKSWLDL